MFSKVLNKQSSYKSNTFNKDILFILFSLFRNINELSMTNKDMLLLFMYIVIYMYIVTLYNSAVSLCI